MSLAPDVQRLVEDVRHLTAALPRVAPLPLAKTEEDRRLRTYRTNLPATPLQRMGVKVRIRRKLTELKYSLKAVHERRASLHRLLVTAVDRMAALDRKIETVESLIDEMQRHLEGLK